jgi:hypothetical protein
MMADTQTQGRNWTGLILRILMVLVALLLALAIGLRLAFHVSPAPLAATIPSSMLGWQGALAAASDLDQSAMGYATGELNLLPGQSDQVTILGGARPAMLGRVAASNSVIGWATTFRGSRDGRYLYLAEIRGQAAPGTERIEKPYMNFPRGRFLSVIDVSNPNAPKIAARVPIGINPSAVDISADGQWIAVASDELTRPLFLLRLENGLPTGEPQRFDISYPGDSPRTGIRSVRFSPTGPFLALNLSDRQVAFYKLTSDASGMARLTLHGKPVSPPLPNIVLTEVEFTPDGRHLLVPSTRWGDQTPRYMLTSMPGSIVSIRFDASAAATHAIADIAEVGRGPEALEISPDGRFAISVNMERTYLPPMAILRIIFGGNEASSLSLVAIDPQTGKLSPRPRVRFNAMLPEDALFDSTGRNVALAVYERPGGGQNGYVEFWRIDGKGANAKLVNTGHVVTLPRGVHDLEYIPEITNRRAEQ